jgi:hypothetical protein
MANSLDALKEVIRLDPHDLHPVRTYQARVRAILDQLSSNVFGDIQDSAIIDRHAPGPKYAQLRPLHTPDMETILAAQKAFPDYSLERLIPSYRSQALDALDK